MLLILLINLKNKYYYYCKRTIDFIWRIKLKIIIIIIIKFEKQYYYCWKTTIDLIWRVKIKIKIIITITIINNNNNNNNLDLAFRLGPRLLSLAWLPDLSRLDLAGCQVELEY